MVHVRQSSKTRVQITVILILNLIGDKEKPTNEVSLYLSCLSSLTVRNEYCQLVSDKKGLKLLFELLVNPDQKSQVVKESLLLLKAVAGNDNVKNDIRVSKGIGIIVDAIMKNIVSTFLLTSNFGWRYENIMTNYFFFSSLTREYALVVVS